TTFVQADDGPSFRQGCRRDQEVAARFRRQGSLRNPTFWPRTAYESGIVNEITSFLGLQDRFIVVQFQMYYGAGWDWTVRPAAHHSVVQAHFGSQSFQFSQAKALGRRFQIDKRIPLASRRINQCNLLQGIGAT